MNFDSELLIVYLLFPSQFPSQFSSQFSSLSEPAPVDPPQPVPSEPLLPLQFYKGRRGGTQCSYNGYAYTYDRTIKAGMKYWQCLHRRQCTPNCTGRLTTLDDTIVREKAHSHSPQPRDVHKVHLMFMNMMVPTNYSTLDV